MRLLPYTLQAGSSHPSVGEGRSFCFICPYPGPVRYQKTTFCAALAVAISVTCPAQERAPLNDHLPHWLTLGIQNRVRSEGVRGQSFNPGDDHDFLLERSRFSVDLAPKSWLGFFGEVQDSRAFWFPRADGSVKDTLDLRQAYVRFGDEKGFWDLKVGRQRLAFGTERMIGAAEWGNTARVFDAARLGLHWSGKDRVDIFSSSIVGSDVDHWDHHRQGNNLHGIYGSLGSWVPGAKVEPYLVLRDDHNASYHSWTTGLRMAGTFAKVWAYDVDTQRQTGANRANSLSAWAFTFRGDRFFPSLRWQPSLMTEFNYASGDKHPGDGITNTLDQLYPTNHGIYGVADVIGRRNAKNIRGGLWIRPRRWLTLKTEGHGFWLASRYDGLYVASGALAVNVPITGAAATHVGNEIDIIGEVKLNRHYDIGAQYGHLFSGAFLDRYTAGGDRGFYAVFLDWRL